MSKALGTFRAVYLGALCCVGSFLFAYDTGIVGGILTFPSFRRDFGYSESHRATVASNSTSLLQAGGTHTHTLSLCLSLLYKYANVHPAFFACFFIWPFTARFGRRWSLVLASAIFNVGAAVQTANTHSLAAFYAARVVSGVGVGMATVVVPMYSAEMAPARIRGVLGSFFQFFFTCGVMTSYWVDYAASRHISDASSAQWQLPVGLQLVPGVVLGLGMLLTRESCRWLAGRGRLDEAWESLVWVRGGEETEEVREEFREIVRGVEEEGREREGVSVKELWLPINRWRVLLIVALQMGKDLAVSMEVR